MRYLFYAWVSCGVGFNFLFVGHQSAGNPLPAEAGADYNSDYTGAYYLLFWHEAGKNYVKNNLAWSAAEIENIESYLALKDASDFEHG